MRPPRVMNTDKLASYGAAKKETMLGVEHRRHKGLNNRAEYSHQPKRRRERQTKRFKSPGQGAFPLRPRSDQQPPSCFVEITSLPLGTELTGPGLKHLDGNQRHRRRSMIRCVSMPNLRIVANHWSSSQRCRPGCVLTIVIQSAPRSRRSRRKVPRRCHFGAADGRCLGAAPAVH